MRLLPPPEHTPARWPLRLTGAGEGPTGDLFGYSVSVEGEWAVIGAKLRHDGMKTDTGAFSVTEVREQNVQFLHPDHLGSPVAATDVFGDVVGTQNFYPFGEVRASSGVFDTERGFTGQIFDGGTGLGFYNARYYDTALGKFVSPDSIVPDIYDATMFNKFASVGNRPLVFLDPSGKTKCQTTDCHAEESASQTPQEQEVTSLQGMSGPVVFVFHNVTLSDGERALSTDDSVVYVPELIVPPDAPLSFYLDVLSADAQTPFAGLIIQNDCNGCVPLLYHEAEHFVEQSSDPVSFIGEFAFEDGFIKALQNIRDEPTGQKLPAPYCQADSWR